MPSIVRTIILFFFLCVFSGLEAQELDPVKWLFDINQVGPDSYELFYQASLVKGWNIYSQEIESGGPIPTSINYTSDNVIYEGFASESGDRKEGMDEVFEMNLIKYGSDVPFRMKHKVKISDTSKPVTGYITYMVCNDKTCLPPTDAEFSFTIKILNAPGGGQ